MKKFVKPILIVFIITMIASCITVSTSAAVIQNNGYRGITIDIHSGPYSRLAADPNWGQWAYTTSGCAWFATARVEELTGKWMPTIYAGENWYTAAYSRFGFTRGGRGAPRAKALACYKYHVSVVEQVNGDNVLISTGGYRAGNSGTGYTAIYEMTVSQLESNNGYTGDFLGYVYLGVGGSWKTGLTKSNPGNEFHGRIVNTAANKALQVQPDGNVVLATKSNSLQQYFHFTRNSDGTYKIISDYNKLSMEVQHGTNENTANLSTYTYHGGGGQRWSIYGSFLTADCTECVIDLSNGSTADGTNIWLYYKNDSAAQKFSLEIVSAPAAPVVNVSENGKTSVFTWKQDAQAAGYTMDLAKNGSLVSSDLAIKPTVQNGICTYSTALGDGDYTLVLTAKNQFYSTRSTRVSFSVGYNSADSWIYTNTLPASVTASNYKIEYRHTYEQIAKAAPGAEWTKGALAKTEYENSGATYTSALPLATSETRVLADYYYYHYCGAGTGNNANFAQTGSYNHYDGVGKENVYEASSHQDYDDSRYTYYRLKDKNGNDFYCRSSVTCDGAFGSHGARTCYWYKMYVYQNKAAVNYYKYTKTGSWTSAKDATATSVQYRYKPLTAAVKNPFTDVKSGKFYYDAVQWAVNGKITNGMTATTFAPDATCTRGQIVTFLWRAAGSPKPKTTQNPFADVKKGQFYFDAVLWAVENGITNGTGATTFSPNNPCTRGQVVTFLWRAKGSQKVSATNPFADVKAGAFYKDAVQWAVKNQITNGLSATSFGPNAACTRGQIVTFLYRAYK